MAYASDITVNGKALDIPVGMSVVPIVGSFSPKVFKVVAEEEDSADNPMMHLASEVGAGLMFGHEIGHMVGVLNLMKEFVGDSSSIIKVDLAQSMKDRIDPSKAILPDPNNGLYMGKGVAKFDFLEHFNKLGIMKKEETENDKLKEKKKVNFSFGTRSMGKYTFKR